MTDPALLITTLHMPATGTRLLQPKAGSSPADNLKRYDTKGSPHPNTCKSRFWIIDREEIVFSTKTNAFEDMARTENWYRSATGVFGLYNGYFFQLAVRPSGRHYARAFIDVLPGVAQTQIKAAIENRKKELKIHNYKLDSHTIEIEFLYKLFRFQTTTARAMVDFISDLLKSLNVPAVDRCHACRAEAELENYYFSKDDTAVRYCRRCYESVAPPMHTRLEPTGEAIKTLHDLVERTYFDGFWGALVVSVAMALMMVVISMFVVPGHESWGVGLAWIVAASYGGYNRTKGKQGEFDKWIVLAAGTVGLVLAVYVYHGLRLLVAGYDLVKVWQMLVSDPETTTRMLADGIGGFVGSIIVWVPIYIKMERDARAKPLEVGKPTVTSPSTPDGSPHKIVSPAVKVPRFPDDPNLSLAWSLKATDSEDKKKKTHAGQPGVN